MPVFNTPDLAELPTIGQLNQATILAVGVAAALLVTTILPAEYGIDPTGIGSVLGLTEMGRVKRAQQALGKTGPVVTAATAPRH